MSATRSWVNDNWINSITVLIKLNKGRALNLLKNNAIGNF